MGYFKDWQKRKNIHETWTTWGTPDEEGGNPLSKLIQQNKGNIQLQPTWKRHAITQVDILQNHTQRALRLAMSLQGKADPELLNQLLDNLQTIEACAINLSGDLGATHLGQHYFQPGHENNPVPDYYHQNEPHRAGYYKPTS